QIALVSLVRVLLSALRTYLLFVLMTRPPSMHALFPYTTLFRSIDAEFSLTGGVDVSADVDFTNLSLSVAATVNEQLNTTLDFQRSEEHTSNSSHEWISYAVFCLKKKNPTRE